MSTLKIKELAETIDFNREGLEDNEVYKKLREKVDAYIGRAKRKCGRNEKRFLKVLESKIDGKWVFDCLDEIFSHSVCSNWKPIYVVNHYRGLRFTDAKQTSKFTPSDQKQYNCYNTYLKNYEKVQGDGRHTLNSLLSDFAESKNIIRQIIVCCQFAEKTELMSGDTWISLNLSNEIREILLGENDEIIHQIATLTETGENENTIKEKLQTKRKYALYSALGGDKEEHKVLNKLLHDFTAVFFVNSDELESGKENIWLEILQVLQGICLWLIKFGGLLISLVSREFDKRTRSDCVGEFFALGINNSEVSAFCQNVFPVVDSIQRYYFEMVLQHIPAVSEDAYKSLGFALQNRYDPKRIADLLEETVFNFNSLAGVIRLAEVIRPFAVHEGKQQTISFVVGRPYLRKDKLEVISKFCDGNIISWRIPGNDTQRPTENEALHIARARIMGSSQILQDPGVALFVDCNYDEPTCNHVVRAAPRGVIGRNASILNTMANVKDAFIVKIIGQKKIEIFYKGDKILVWSHINVTWEKETTWDANSLNTFISKKLKIKEDNKNAVRILAKTVYQISQKQGEGSSFIIYKDNHIDKDALCPPMTIPFPELGEGEITDSKKLLNVAIEDGGTLIELTSNKFYGRRQWLPHRINKPPFWHENFSIPEDAWNSIIEEVWNDDVEDNVKCIAINDSPPKLYSICRYKYFKKTENGLPRYLKNKFYWEEWYKILSWGTRHISSMGMSACLWDKAVAVVVSADSAISVFYQGIETKSLNG